MNDYGMIIETGTLRIQRLLPGPIERVWAYLTESDKRATWLAAGEMKLENGAQVELVFRNSDLTGEHEQTPAKYKHLSCSVSNVGHITCLFPPRLLSFTWAEQGQSRPSEVTFELTEQGKAVLLTVTHRRLANRDEMLSVAGGWHTHLDILVDRLLAPEPAALFRLLNRPPTWLSRDVVQDLRQFTEEFTVVLNDLASLTERIRLLQEEIGAKQMEQNNRTLYTLTVITVLALPINIVAGFFGMNVGGIPLASNHHGFVLLVLLVGGFTLVTGYLAFRRRDEG